MQMLYRLASIGTAVGYNAVAAAEFFSLGNLGDSLKDLCNKSAVFRIDLINGRDVNLGHYKNMYRCLRIYIAECIDVFVLIDL